MKNEPGILDPIKIPLHGRHMIEASAGTGKTYNITRIYVRLLVESSLSVNQILVMTFTEAATEEIKERLASFIEELLRDFYIKPCSFSQALRKSKGDESTFNTLSIAHLELDLASIYTINGFCQRVIGRFGLSMALPQNAELVTDFKKITLAYVTDALRALRNAPEKYVLLQNESFHDPANFLQQFGDLIGSQSAITVVSAESFLNAQVNEFNACWLEHNENRQALIASILVEKSILYQGVKSGEKTVEPEIIDAIDWLSKSALIPSENSASFFNKWLGFNKASKVESKEAEGELVNAAFNKLFSTVRIKNYIKAGMSAQHPLITNALQLLADIKTQKGLGETKRNLIKNIRKVPLYQLVYQVINSVNVNINKHKQIHGVIGFNDQIEGVAKAMDTGGKALIESLQQEYPAALVDEFQDTDEHQYSILEHLFPKGAQDRLLLMIGDPKQAIYSFRGGDIYTYLKAKKESDYEWGMDVNYRSSIELINCYNRIFHGAPLNKDPLYLFDENIEYPLVKSPVVPPKNISIVDTELSQGNAAFSYICANALLQAHPSEVDTSPTRTTKDAQVTEILNWCANEAARLLSEVYIDEDGTERLVQSEDIAVLVRSKSQATLVKQVFNSHGLATVFLGEKTPLFESPQALHMLWFLQAVHQPTRENIRQAISTGLVNIDDSLSVQSSVILMDDGHPSWETVFANLAGYRAIWLRKGVYALLQSVIQKAVVQNKESERQLTNYMHIAELLANASVTNSSALLLIHWLHNQITEAKQSDAHELRLESDQKLIKIVTQHKSKGLEYPIVFLPFANHIYTPSSPHTAVFHDENFDRLTQIGVSSEAQRKTEKEALAEDMRLLYVSLTRPILRCYLGVFALEASNKSALMRALGISVNSKESGDAGVLVHEDIKNILADISPNVFVTMADKLIPISQPLPEQIVQDTSLLPFTGNINKMWQVTSFSKLSRLLIAGLYDDSPYGYMNAVNLSFSRDDEEDSSIPIQAVENSINSELKLTSYDDIATSYRFVFPKGPDAGNLLHDVLEQIDFTSPNVSGVLQSLGVSTINSKIVDTEKLSQWIEAILVAPFTLLNDFCLKNLSEAQTLKESEFYFPIHSVNTQALLGIVNTYRQQLSQHFNFTLPANLAIHTDNLQGAMHGFIDLIFECEGKYYVADYKSNFLGDDLQAYHSKNLAQDILKHHYDIQYLIYSLALHRYLTAFLPDYNYDQHFGGVYYLYLRGMGVHQNKDCGIFYHKIDGQLVTQLDHLFDVNDDATLLLNADTNSKGAVN